MEYPGTVYATLQKMTLQTSLVPMKKEGIDVPTKVVMLSPTITKPSNTDTECYFTDGSLYTTGWNQPGTCNQNVNDPDHFYFSLCTLYRLCYSLPYDPSDYDFTITAPAYSDDPYSYIHEPVVLGKRMNVFNMYISYDLSAQLEAEVQKFFLARTGIPLERNYPGPSQLKTHPMGDVSSYKIQMNVRDEYLYWAVETILLNYEELKSYGVNYFKFVHLVGEVKLLYNEIFPMPNPGEPYETYVEEKEYRREMLGSPTIIFYLNARDMSFEQLGVILRRLCELFPTPISGIVPRFNYRVNDNIFFSIDGYNLKKYDKPGIIPTEYQLILSDPVKYKDYNKYSRYLTGHDLLVGTEINNIKSYQNLFAIDTSFRELYTGMGIGDLYDTLWQKIGLRPFEQLGGKTYKKKVNSMKTRKGGNIFTQVGRMVGVYHGPSTSKLMRNFLEINEQKYVNVRPILKEWTVLTVIRGQHVLLLDSRYEGVFLEIFCKVFRKYDHRFDIIQQFEKKVNDFNANKTKENNSLIETLTLYVQRYIKQEKKIPSNAYDWLMDWIDYMETFKPSAEISALKKSMLGNRSDVPDPKFDAIFLLPKAPVRKGGGPDGKTSVAADPVFVDLFLNTIVFLIKLLVAILSGGTLNTFA